MIGKMLMGGVGAAVIGSMYGAKKGMNALMHGTQFTNPIMPTASQSKMYGKRGIDGNRLNTQGLTQKLHTSRRKF